jgi:hypothetical protein
VVFDCSTKAEFQEHNTEVADAVLKIINTVACPCAAGNLLKALGKRTRNEGLVSADFGRILSVI